MSTVDEIRKVMQGLTPAADPGYGRVWFNPETGELRYSLSDSDEQERYDEWSAAFRKISGVEKIDGDAEIGAPSGDGWVTVGKVSEAWDPQTNRKIDIAFLMGSGRLNWDVEQEIMAVLGTDDLRSWNRAMKTATPEQIDRIWKIAKATPAGRELAESGPFERLVERSWSHAAIGRRSQQRRTDPGRQQRGRIAARDPKKSGGQRHGQRQRSARRGRA